MTEAQVGLLYNIASTISESQNNNSNLILKSYYLMRCKDITRGYGLPEKHYSSKTRCPNCCIEWTKNTEIKVRSIKLSKRQKQRLKSRKNIHNKKEIKCKKDLLLSNELEQICMFCKKSTITPILKPPKHVQPSITKQKITPLESSKPNIQKNYKRKIKHKSEVDVLKPSITAQKIATHETTKPNYKQKNNKNKINPKAEVNVYANALDIFSLQNKNNTLASTIKEKPKVINNNKKKKDKFAGLCQKAVLASAKLKETKNKQNSLNLFLKPSSA